MRNSAVAAVNALEEALAQAEEPDTSEFVGNDNLDIAYDEDAPIPEGVPSPTIWRVLVMPVRPKKVSAGGIVLPTVALEAEDHFQMVGRLVAVGPLYYRAWKYAASLVDYLRILVGIPPRHAPRVGDWVVYGRFAGQRCEFKGVRLIMLNDDELLSVTNGPRDFKVYV